MKIPASLNFVLATMASKQLHDTLQELPGAFL
jgi:hypothetical protein